MVRNLSTRVQHGLTLLENLADSRPSSEDWLAARRAEQKPLRSFRISGHRPLNPFKAGSSEGGRGPAAPRPVRKGKCGWRSSRSVAASEVHRGNAGARRPARVVPRADDGAVAADGADSAEALSAAGDRVAGHGEVSGRGSGPGRERGSERGVCRAARLPARRSRCGTFTGGVGPGSGGRW